MISTHVTLVLVADFKNWEESSLEFLLVLEFPLEYLLHISQTSSYGSWNTSHAPIRFNISKYSY